LDINLSYFVLRWIPEVSVNNSFGEWSSRGRTL